jgi:hypothetical protein
MVVSVFCCSNRWQAAAAAAAGGGGGDLSRLWLRLLVIAATVLESGIVLWHPMFAVACVPASVAWWRCGSGSCSAAVVELLPMT